MLFGKRILHHHKLCRTRNEDRHVVLLHALRVLTVKLYKPQPYQMIYSLLCVLHGQMVHLSELFNTVIDTGLFEAQHELHFVLRKDMV